MNKIYKVMYSKVKQCAVVVSEIAKSHGHNGESSGVRKHAALTAAVLIALGSLSFTTAFVPMTAEAATKTVGSNFVGVERTDGLLDDKEYDNYGGKGANGADSITLGLRAKAGEGTITIGDRNASASLGSVYVGQGDIANPKLDTGGWATSIGYNSDATGYGSIALGSNAVAENSYALDSKGNSLKLNDDTKFRLNPKPDIQRASVAIGYGAKADNGNIAIGSYSDASTDLRTAKTKDGKEIKSYLTDKMADSYVSVGDGKDHSETQYRRISNVADGAADSDAATIAQLKEAVKETDASKKANIDASNIGSKLKKADGKTPADSSDITTNEDAWGEAIGTGEVKENNGQLVTGGTVYSALENQKKDLSVHAGWGISVAKDEDGKTISLKRNLGTNYGNLGWGEGKVTFEASGQNSLILGGAASVSEYDHNSDVKAGVYGKDSVLVGGFNNLIGEKGETSVIVGGQENQVTNQESVIVGGFGNKVTGSKSVVVGGVSNEASGSGDGVFGGFRNKVSGMESVVLGGQTNEVTGMNSVVSGGTDNKVSGHYASANGGKQNTISGDYAATLGGFNNQSRGMFSNAIGGDNNITSGQYSMTSGGSGNTASGDNSYIGGGHSNQAAGVGASVFGGYRSKVNGILSTGVGGGSTNNRAIAALAAGYQSMVTDGGVAYRSLTSEERSKIYKGQQYWPGFSGILVDNDTKVLDRISTAIGYQATADAPGVISFGHDKGDNSSENGMYSSAYYNRLVKAADGIEDHDAVVMEQLKNASDVGSKIKVYQTDENGNIKFDKNNNPIEDTSDSDAVKTKREAAQKASEDAWGEAIGTGKVEANNSQLVTGDTVYNAIQNQAEWKLTTNGESADKAAAIKPGTTVNFSAEKAEKNGKDHSNVTISHNGSNVTIGLDKDIVLGDTSHSSGGSLNVYTDSSDGNNLSNHVSINGSTISVNYPKSNDDKKTPTDTRGVILGVGEEDSKPDGYIAFNNVEGGYTYLHASTNASDDKKGRLEYVGSDGNKKYIANLDDVSTAVNNAKTKYYAVNEKAPLMNLDTYKNEGNDGAKGMGSLAAGFVTHADGIASTVAGSYSGVINSGKAQGLDLRGAAALSYGTFNVNQNTEAKKEHSGVANSIVGQVNVTKDSNAAIIYGAGNIVTDSYRPIDEKKAADILGSTSDPKALSKAMQDAVKDSGGQVMVMGGGNSVDKAYMTQVVGVGNKVTGQDSTYAEKTSTQYNFVDGFQNELKNGKNDYIIGTKNKVSGDSVDKNQSNIIFGDNHTLTNTKNAVIIGSSDKVTEIAGSDAVSIGYNANAGGESVALGSNAVAGGNALAVGPYANAKNNSIALGIHASATSSQNLAIGYYANVTGRPDTIKNSVALGASSTVGEKDILSTDNGFGVLSIGAKDKERRIIHVRAGVNDTDAVNVSQLKSVQSGLTDKGLTFVTNDGEHIAKLGSKVTIQGTAKKADHEYTADNLTTEIDKDGNITILMDKDMSVEKLAVNGKPGTPGSIGVKGQDGQSGVGIDGKDGISIKGRDGKDGVTIKAVDGKDGTEGHIGLTGPAGTNGKDGTNAVDITVKNGYNTEAKDGKDGINGEKGVDGTSLTRVVYEDKNGEHQIATLEDGLKFKGDNGKEISKKLNNTLEIIGGAKGDLTEGNIGVNSTTDGKLKVQLAKDLTGLNSATYTTTTGEGESAKTSTTVVNANGLTINGGPSITNNGIDGGKKTITNVGSGIKAGTDGKYTVTDANNSNAANIGDVNNMVKQAVGELSDATKTNLAGKANVDASNLTAGDVTKWQDKLGNGKVESGNTGLVTGDTVFNAVDTKANRDGSNLTDKEADSFSEKIAKGEVKPGENRAVSGDAVSQAISKVTGDMNTKLDGKANTSLDNITKDGQTVIKKLSQDAVQVKGGTAITVDDNVDDKGNKTYMISANNNGKVEKDDGNLISGDTLYKEVHVDKDGTYIKSKDSATGKDMTVAQNLSALDTGLKTTSDLIHMNDKGDIQIGGSSKATKIDVSGKDSYGKTTGRVITGVVTDAQDASSAANVGYVNGVTAANTQQIYRDMNSAYGRLNNNINKAAAGSNALAALHPLDYDPDDKADFAVGYGHYRNANAAAVGAFYHPNENTMVNVGVSLGNGDPGFNAGVSFKVGRGSAGREAMSRTEMAKVINSQSKEIDALKKDNADKDKRIDALEQKMAEILAKLDKNGK